MSLDLPIRVIAPGKKIGTFVNKFIKSYGSTFFWIRRPAVCFISCMIAQIDEEEYARARGTGAWR